jgi:selenocysteine lyase/cysteine desulfurase
MQNAKGLGRRGFVKGVGMAALAVGFFDIKETKVFMDSPGVPHHPDMLSTELQAPPRIKGNPGSDGYWDHVRKAFPLPDNYIHMNTGTTGSQPLFSLSNLGVYNLYKSMDPRDWEKNLNARFPDLFPTTASAIAARQAAIAAMYGANDDEIVLSYCTTDACNLIFAGTPWNTGDRIITTHWEHPATAGPTAWARDYHGVEVRIVELPTNFTSSITKADVLGLFEAELNRALGAGNKQYLVVSEIFYKNGLRLPIKELTTLARSYGAYTIIDTAHGWGQIPINCHDYGADFICGAGHKWLCGGPGTGIFYIRNSGSDLPPFSLGNFSSYGDLFVVPSARYDNRNWSPAGAMQGRGETNTPALYAMTDSASFFNAVGLANIYARSVAMGDHLKQKIAAQWGPRALWVQKNPDPAFATALTSFNPFAGRDKASQFSAMNAAMQSVLNTLAAEDPRIYIRTVTWHDRASDSADNRIGFRVSTHAMYNNFEQVHYMFERLVAAVNATGLPQLLPAT